MSGSWHPSRPERWAPSAPPRHSRYSTCTTTLARTDIIEDLTSRQRAHLRSLAHHLKPILQVGTEGVTSSVIDSIRESFNTRELLKVKVHESAPLPVEGAADEIAREIPGAKVAQTIGRTMVLYRPFTEEPEIRLPK